MPKVHTSSHLRSGLNVIRMCRPGHQYLWHRDSQPFTLLLYLAAVGTGGVLELAAEASSGSGPGADAVAVTPRAGTVVLFDGLRCWHRVTPMAGVGLRLSVPMAYPTRAVVERPSGRDDRLYGPEQRPAAEQ